MSDTQVPKKRDRITVVTPSYNQCKLLRENINSLDRQGDPNLEQVVVDGTSTDGTPEMLAEATPGYELRWISEPDDGQSAAINKGIEMASGEWIAWLNADDYYYPGALSAARDHMDETVDILYGDFCFVDADRNELYHQYNTLPSKLSERFWTRFAGNHCTVFRREVLDAIGPMNECLEYTMDTDLFWRLLTDRSEFSFRHIPQTLAARRLHRDAKTVGQSTAVMERIQSEKEQIYGGYVPDSGIEKIAVSAVGLGAKTAWTAYEALHPRYDLSTGRALKSVYTDYRRAMRAAVGTKRKQG